MAGMNLLSALSGLQQGYEERANIDAMKANERILQAEKEADAAYGAVMQQSQDKWQRSGAQGTYRPSDETQFAAAEARGNALAANGHLKGYLQNEALVSSQRIRARARAVSDYESDGDPEKLARTVYPTIFNGKKIAGTKKIAGSPAVPGIGNLPPIPASPDSVEIEYDDGTKEVKAVPELVAGLKRSLLDPVATAAAETENNFKAALERVKAEGRVGVEEVKGRNAAAVADVKGGYTLRNTGARFAGNTAIHEMDNTAKKEIAAGKDATSLAVAGTQAGASVKVGAGHDEATKEAAKTGAAGREAVAKIKVEAPPKTKDPALDLKNRLAVIGVQAGISNTKEPLTGKPVPDALTVKAEARVRQLESTGIKFSDAVDKVRAEIDARKPAVAP